MTPLTQLRLSEVVVGRHRRGDRHCRHELFRGRLMAMGIVPGISLSVVRGGRRHPLVIGLPGCHLMIDARRSDRVIVRDPRDRRETEEMSA